MGREHGDIIYSRRTALLSKYKGRPPKVPEGATAVWSEAKQKWIVIGGLKKPMPPPRERKPIPPQMQRTFERAEQAKQIYLEKQIEKQLPPDVVITEIEETPEGYEVAYIPKPVPTPTKEPTWKETTFTGQVYQKGLVPSLSEQFAQTVLGWSPERVRQARTFKTAQEEARYRVTPEVIIFKRTSAEFQAGLVAVGESWVRPEVPTPIGAGIQKILGQPTAYETGEVSPWYLLGGLAGTYVEAKAIGYAVGKTYAGLKKFTPKVIKRPLGKATQVVAQKIKVFPLAKVAHKAKLWYIEHKPWVSKAKYVSPGEVAPPMFPKEPLSMAKLKAVETAWLMETAPRTSAVTIGKIGLEPVVGTPMKHLIFRAGKISIGYLRELRYVSPVAEQKGMLPYVTQQQLTRMGIMPYVPKAITATGKKAVGYGVTGLVVPALAKTRVALPQEPRQKRREIMPLITVPKPKIWQPTLAKEREKFRPLIVLEPKPKEREQLISIPKIIPKLVQPQVPKLETLTIQKQKQILAPKIPTLPSLTIPRALPFYPRIPRGGRDISRRKGPLFGKWFLRRHEVITPKELASHFFGHRKRKKRRKGGVMFGF